MKAVIMIHFGALSAGWNAILFSIAAAMVWYAGVWLTRYARIISDRLGGQQALVGTLLLGGIVSLPEMATSMSASIIGNAPLAINTLLGGISVTMAILAIVDAKVGWEPLSVDIAHPIILLQGTFVILFLAITAAGIIVGDLPVPGTGIGAWTGAILLLYIVFLLLIKRFERSQPWVPRHVPGVPADRSRRKEKHDHFSTRGLVLRTATAATILVIAGFLLASTADALAGQTGLGAKFIGMVLGGISTSLPELSTTLSAVRLRQYEMAFADAFGTNLCSVMLLFFADFAYPKQPLLNEAGPFSVVAILLGIVLTAVYLAGLIARRNYALFNMGIDSIIVLLVYAAGLVLLFHLR